MKRTREGGLTLIEILVALALSMILLAGVVQIFLANRQTYAVVEDFSRIQENGRFAVDHLGRILREAGFIGCATGSPTGVVNTLNAPQSLEYNFAEGLRGYEYRNSAPGDALGLPGPVVTRCGDDCDTALWQSARPDGTLESIPAHVASDLVPGSDVLVVRGAFATRAATVSRTNSSAMLFAVDDASLGSGPCPSPFDGETMYSGLCPGDIVVASDCEKGWVFQVTGLHPASGELNITHASGNHTDCPDTDGNGANSYCPGNAMTSWGGASRPPAERFGPGAELRALHTHLFFVGRDDADGRPGLYRRTGEADPELLIDNVESFQVLYGEDTDGAEGPEQFLPADQVTDFERVVSVRLDLLLSAPGESSPETDTRAYNLGGVLANPADDRRLRRVFSTVVALRNRMP